MNLYRKYRPEELGDLVGLDKEVAAIEKILEKENPSQAYILHGPAGCGKTTIARILARKFGADDFTTNELNTGEERGIDSARAIIDKSQYSVGPGKARAFIIDEAHGWTKEAKRALLKPLEDIPKGVFYFLCTSNLAELTKDDEGRALRSRCTEIPVRAIDPEVLYRLLRRVALKEGKDLPKRVLEEIAENSGGSARRALVTLEKVIDLSDEETMLELIQQPEEAQREIIELCRHFLSGNPAWSTLAGILRNLGKEEPERNRLAVLGYMNAVLLKKDSPAAAVVLEAFAEPFFNAGASGLTLAAYQAYISLRSRGK